jgi:hypothetical protein
MNTYYNRIKRAGKMEVKPGMYIREKELIEMSGVTRFSLLFWNEIRGKVGEIVKAEMKKDKRENWSLWLTSKDGVTVILHGCSAGYGGEGPRGTIEVLESAGFNPKRVREIVFNKETFSLRRKVQA